jgi:hypothetical protein
MLLAAGQASQATARVETGVAVRMEPTETVAEPGRLYEGRLLLLAHTDVDLTDLVLDGEDWIGLTWNTVVPARVGPDRPLVVEFSGTPLRGDAPLRVITTTDLCTERRTFILGGPEFEKMREVKSLGQVELSVPAPILPPMAKPAPFGPRVLIDDEPAPEEIRVSYGIRVRGRFIHARADTTFMGTDGMTVRVYDDDVYGDDLLGTTTTDAAGYFDVVVEWESQLEEDYPDLKVVFVTENDEIRVKPPYGSQPYTFERGVWSDFTGTDLNLAWVIPDDEDDQAIPHLLTNYTRFWRYLDDRGHDTRFLEVNFPTADEDGAYYSRTFESIQIPRDNQWSDGTQAHEYGHHVNFCLAPMPEIDYCNTICDDDYPDDCGHCRWCREEVNAAWTEGWAQYIAHVIPPTFDALYGVPAIGTREFEDLHPCHIDTLWDDPTITEGFTGAVLVDIDDAHNEIEPHWAVFEDRMSLGGRAVLDVLRDYDPMSTMEFLAAVLAAYPDRNEDLWWTAKNNGFEIDQEPPDMVVPIICQTHTAGVPSPNPNPVFAWSRPDDDASGVSGYDVVINEGGPISPVGGGSIGDVTTHSYSGLVPGTYYFSIQPKDWAGNSAVDYTSFGPIVITEADPVNLVLEVQPGWDFYVVPRQAPDATPESCTLPALLDGTVPTYWNLLGRNEGDIETGDDMVEALQVDGVVVDTANWGSLPGGYPALMMNGGPVDIRGGLHTFTGCLDPDNLVDETDESDNAAGIQLTWRPPMLTPRTVYYNATPVPDPTGGWESVLSPFKVYNCFGANFSSSGRWNAFVMWSDDPAADYDLRLFEEVESSTGGFTGAVTSSSQPAGWTDAVLVNRLQVSNQDWDVGIINPDLAEASLKYEHHTSAGVAFGDSLTELMELNEYLILREFEVDETATGGITLDLWTYPPTADILFAWLDADFTTGGLLDTDAAILTGPSGQARLEIEVPNPGFTCLMICRQPKDGDDDLWVTYRIRPTLPDLEPAHLAGWHAPVTPRQIADATVDLVELPTVLEGGYEQTWYNFAVGNASNGTALGAMRFHVGLDGNLGPVNYFHTFDIPGGATFAVVNEGPYTVPGGRHTVVLDIDALNTMVELDEANNTYGEQYAWAPEWLYGMPVTRPAPPDRTGGWEHIASGNPAYFNCDGLRSMYMSTFWFAFAVMPGAASDVDVRLHEVYSGVQNGFGVNLAHSSWGVGQSDYVLVNNMLAGLMPYDAGVLNITGSEDYTAEDQMDSYLPAGAVVHGPVTMGASEILDLYETTLTSGEWYVRLENTAGTVDWGVTVHPGDQAFMSKTDVLQDAAGWLAGPGVDEYARFMLTESQTLAIAVWKVGAADLLQTGEYILHVAQGAPSPVGDEEIPAVTRMASVHPNPFNPQTTVEFDLARPGAVDLAVYDLSGRRIATLVRTTLPAGRFRESWQGLDASGQRVASGVYFVRLCGDGKTDLRKVMLVK